MCLNFIQEKLFHFFPGALDGIHIVRVCLGEVQILIVDKMEWLSSQGIQLFRKGFSQRALSGAVEAA